MPQRWWATGWLFVVGSFPVVPRVTQDGLASITPITVGIDPHLTVSLTGDNNCGRIAGAACARVGHIAV